MRKQKGLSLVELMISMALGLVLMTGVIQMFITSNTTFATHQAISRVQENGRFAMEFLARDIRMAGFMGGMSRNMDIDSTLNVSEDDSRYNFETGIEGVTVGPTGAVPNDYPEALPNTDVLVVRSANGGSVGLTRNKDAAQLNVGLTGSESGACPDGDDRLSGLCANDVVVIADCEKAKVFQITAISISSGEVNIRHASSGSIGNSPTSWGGSSIDPSDSFSAESEVIKVSTTFYYLANNAAGRPSLWQREGDQPAQELLEGVEDMQLTYGRDTSGNGIPDEYQTATAIAGANAWDAVSSVRVQLLVQSVGENVLDEPQSYTFNGTLVEPDDRRLRQVFVNTIAIRSRLP